MKNWRSLVAGLSCCAMLLTLPGCGNAGAAGQGEKVVIYSNADEEAITAMQNALDANGFKDQYILQTMGTSDLGGKLMAEGADIEADLITMSSYYVDSAQQKSSMFLDMTFQRNTLGECPSYAAPITAQEGTIIVNTGVLAENDLPMPTCIKDLADPVYQDQLAVTDIMSSSTAWLLVQAIVSEYGTGDAGKEVLTGLIRNAGDHLETSGSSPLKLARAGEVAVAFGLRHQAVADQQKGLPIAYVDPTEGNFMLTESVAVVDKGDQTNPKAMQMAQCIVEKARAEIIETYPNALYEGETAANTHKSAYPKTFSQPLTVDLLQQHQDFSETCKQAAGR